MFRVRQHIAGARSKPRGSRGPADGLLAEIQADVLARHPDWHRRLIELEDRPFKVAGRRRMNEQRPGKRGATR